MNFGFFIDGMREFYAFIGNIVYSFYFNNSRTLLDVMHSFFDGAFKFFLILTMVLALVYLFMSVYVLFFKKTNRAKIRPGDEPFVTIQIPTYNELAALNCAKRCLDFDYPMDKVQIIIGDDSNKSDISEKIDLFASKYPKNVLVTRRGKNIGFKPGNLNHMLEYTKGDFIVVFDSDFLPESDFLKRIIAPFTKDDNVSVVQAKWRLCNFSQNWISVLGGSISLLCHNILLIFMDRVKISSFLCGSAEAIRKKDLIEVGGWTSGSLTEDIECSLRLKKAGKKLVYLEDLECDCEVPNNVKDLSKQQMRWAYGVIYALKMHLFDLFSKESVKLKEKVGVLIFASGYIFSFLLFCVTLFGFLSVVTHEPAPINWALLLSDTLRNILLTSGFLVATFFALGSAKKIRYIPKVALSSFSVGLLVTFYVNVGIFKAIFNRGMQWFMLNKNGNSCVQSK
jgi:cellulose synthase/poly-beta-1,6-N-acetylglucosamine synthase-like glycosyltransferase